MYSGKSMTIIDLITVVIRRLGTAYFKGHVKQNKIVGMSNNASDFVLLYLIRASIQFWEEWSFTTLMHFDGDL